MLGAPKFKMQAPSPNPPAPQGLTGVRNAALLCGGLIAAAFAAFMVLANQATDVNFYFAVFALLFLWPHAVILWRLWRGNSKPALELAMQTSFALAGMVALLTLFIFAIIFSERGMQAMQFLNLLIVAAIWAIFLGSHWFLYLLARRQHRALFSGQPPAKGFRKGMAALLGYYVLVYLFFGASAPSMIRNRTVANESSAAGSLRTLHTTAKQYRDAYNNGYPASLALFGKTEAGEASCRAPDLIDPLLASGRKSGYWFAYQPGAPVAKPAPGCPPGATGYTISARPQEYGHSGRRSFFVDETGAIRWTAEDRAANAKDPTLD